jgi:hypothetical protein
MKSNKLDQVWNKIEEDLQLHYTEENREALYKAIQDLPAFICPKDLWSSIENEIQPKKLTWQKKYYAYAAAVIVFILGSMFYLQTQFKPSTPIQYASANITEYNLNQLADTSNATFDELKNATCNYKPSYCTSEEFKNYETEYQELIAMQEDILMKAKHFDGGEQMEAMLLKIESRKKNIEQELIVKLN